jgi:DNA polymerase-3 subunit chi
MRVMILTQESDSTEKISRLLWTTPAIGFYPHCRAGHRLAPQTPIIVDHIPEPLVHDQVLINLRNETPAMFSRFHRLIEIVSKEAEDRAAARERFRFYRDRGYEIHTHQLGSDA